MIYFVESIPGGGKSYFSRRKYNNGKSKTIYYKEEYYNPIDLLRQAVISKSEYIQLLEDIRGLCKSNELYQIVESNISKEITFLEDTVFLPFLHIDSKKQEVRDRLMKLYYREYDDGKVSRKKYCDILLKRLENFIVTYDRDTDYIFEGALLHNPLFTIMGFYDMNKNEIIEFYDKVYKLLCLTEYEIDYIHVDDVAKAIKVTAQNRINAGDTMWHQGFQSWLKQTRNYSSLKGLEGIVHFANEISIYEEMLLGEIPFRKKIIERRIDLCQI